MNPLEIDIWSDIACPWCWIGKRGLEAAVEAFDAPVRLRFRAFELNPQAPREVPEQVDYVARLANKYNVAPPAAQQMIDRMVEAGHSRGLDLRFDRIRPSNTFDAHRLLAWAFQAGRQTELKEALFSAYLQEGRLISDPAVLVELAITSGLDGDQAGEILQGDAFASEVREDEQNATRFGITGVPCFVFMQAKFAVSGAQPAEVLLQAMHKAQSSGESTS